MSYILDALRRADAERERGRVPGLHSQVSLPREPQAPNKVARSRGLPAWVLPTLLAALAAAALAWWLRPVPGGAIPDRSEATPAVAAPATASQAPAAPSTSPVPTVPSVPAPSTPATPSAAGAGQPQGNVVAAPAPILAPVPPAPPPAPVAPSPRSGPAAPPTSAAAEDALPRVADLSPAARSGLPPLQVSGATYSQTPAMRMLIVDGQVLNEGQDIAPGLKLESIGPRAAVLNHQGRKLRLTY